MTFLFGCLIFGVSCFRLRFFLCRFISVMRENIKVEPSYWDSDVIELYTAVPSGAGQTGCRRSRGDLLSSGRCLSDALQAPESLASMTSSSGSSLLSKGEGLVVREQKR